MEPLNLFNNPEVQTIIDRDMLPEIDAKISSDTRHPIIILNVMSIASTIITGVYAKYTTQLQHLKVARISYGVSLLSVVLTALLAIRTYKQIILLSSLREAVSFARNNQLNRYHQIMQRDPYSFPFIESLRERIPFGNYLLRKRTTQQHLQDRQARLFGHLPLHQQLEDLQNMATACHLVAQERNRRYTGNESYTKQALRTLIQLRRERAERQNHPDADNERLLTVDTLTTLIDAIDVIKQDRLGSKDWKDPEQNVTLTTHALTLGATAETIPPWPEGANLNELDEMLTRFDALDVANMTSSTFGDPSPRRGNLATLIHNVKTRTPWAYVPNEPTAQARYFDLLQSQLLWINRSQRGQMSTDIERGHARAILRDIAGVATSCGGGVADEIQTIYLAETGQFSTSRAEGSGDAHQLILRHWDALKLTNYRGISDQMARNGDDVGANGDDVGANGDDVGANGGDVGAHSRHASIALAKELNKRGMHIPVQDYEDAYDAYSRSQNGSQLYDRYVRQVQENMLADLRTNINNDLKEMLEPWRAPVKDNRYRELYQELVGALTVNGDSDRLALQTFAILAPRREKEGEEDYKRRFQEAKNTLELFAPKIGTESPEAFEERRARGLEQVKSWTKQLFGETDQEYGLRCTRISMTLSNLAGQMNDYQRRYNQGVQLRGEIQQLLLHTTLDYELLQDEQLATLEKSKRADIEEVEKKKETKAKNLIKAEEDERWFNAVIEKAEAALLEAGGPLTEEETRQLEEARGDKDLSKLDERKRLSKYISDFRTAFRLAQSPASLRMLPNMPCFKNLPQEIREHLKLGIAAEPRKDENVNLDASFERELSRKEEARQRKMLFWESPINDSDDEEESYVAPPADGNYLMQESKDLDGNGMPHIFLTDYGVRVLAWGMDLIH